MGIPSTGEVLLMLLTVLPPASVNSSYDQTVSGAILRASRSQSDFALVEITDTGFFSSNPDVVWAGWDSSDTTPDYTVGIHHPSGDIQKVCRDDDQPLAVDDGQEYWQITSAGSGWEVGVTEEDLLDHLCLT